MRHRVAGRHLGRETSHRLSLYRNLVTDLLRYERITTTEAKAKEIRPMAERIITLGRRGDLHARRQTMRFVFDTRVVAKIFDDIGPRMKDRPGGYLRITALEPRKGDGARMSTIELVDYTEAPATPRPQRVTAAPATVPGAARDATTPAPATTAAEETEEAIEGEGEVIAEEQPESLETLAEEGDNPIAEGRDLAREDAIQREAESLTRSAEDAANRGADRLDPGAPGGGAS